MKKYCKKDGGSVKVTPKPPKKPQDAADAKKLKEALASAGRAEAGDRALMKKYKDGGKVSAKKKKK